LSLTERQHGTRAKFVHEACRCFPCRVANANYESDRQAGRRARAPWRVRYVQETGEWWCQHQLTGERQRGLGSQREAYEVRDALNAGAARDADEREEAPPLWADAALQRRVVRHLQALQAAGVGLRTLGQHGGLSRSRLTELVNGASYNRDRPRRRRLKHATALSILEITAADVTLPGAALVDGRETWRLIEELLAAGATRADIATALGFRVPHLQIRREKVLQRTEAAVRALHDAHYRLSSRLRAVCRCPEWS
jgi:hypothetical protein